MGDYFIGELRIFPYPSVIPSGWVPCDGSLLQIRQFTALYALLGTRFGGDGQTTFAVPDLRGRVAVGSFGSYVTGNTGGQEGVTLTSAQAPPHIHSFQASIDTTSPGAAPNGNYLGTAVDGTAAPAFNIYAPTPAPANQVPLNPSTITPAGGGTAHENRQPFAVFRICIATTGLFPPRPF